MVLVPRYPNSGAQSKRARIGRVGVQPYLAGIAADGTPKYRWEYRPAEEVFAPDSMGSFENSALTWDHPSEDVSPDNFGNYGCGFIRDVGKDGDRYLGGTVVFSRRDAFDAYNSGVREVSCGYYRDWDWTPGVFDGTPYDCIQRNIRGNHVALVMKGRAGDSVRILDKADTPILVLDQAAPIVPKAFVTWGDRGYGTVLKIVNDELEIEEEDGRIVLRKVGEVELARPPGERDMPASFRCPSCGYGAEKNVNPEDKPMNEEELRAALDASSTALEVEKAKTAALQQQLAGATATAQDSAVNAKAIATAAMALRDDVMLVVGSMAKDKAEDPTVKAIRDTAIGDYCGNVAAIQRALLKIVAPGYASDALEPAALGHVYEAVMATQRGNLKAAKAEDTGLYTAGGYRELSRLTPGAQADSSLVGMLKKLEANEEAAFNGAPRVSVAPAAVGYLPQAG